MTHFTVNPESMVRKFVSMSQTEEKLNKTASSSPGIPRGSAMKAQAPINWLRNGLSGNSCTLEKAHSSCRFCVLSEERAVEAGIACSCILITIVATQGNIIVASSQLMKRD